MRPFIQRLDRDLVALADVAEDVARGHLAVVEDQLARAAGADAELVFLLADAEPGRIALDDKRRDAVIAGRGVDGREDDEDAGFERVADPELAAREDPVVAAFGGARRQRKRVAAGAGFGQRIRADGVLGQLRQIRAPQLVAAPALQRVDDERVLHVHEDGDGRVDA